MNRKRLAVRHAHEIGAALFRIHVLGKRNPLFVSWNVTFRCNLKCKYCGTHEIKREELKTQEVLAGLDMLWNAGVRWITFGGGEPLIRSDMGEILRYAKGKRFKVFLSTNGSLAAQKREELASVDHVNLSVDGKREIHDAVRGEGAFDRAMQCMDICKELGVTVSFLCVLSKYNIEQVDDVLAIASQRGVQVMFQPATRWLNSSVEPNPISPATDDYRRTVARLIDLKKKGAPVSNSVTGLRHIARWPGPAPIWCVGGTLTAVIEPDGSVLACHLAQLGPFLNHDLLRGSLKERFEGTALPVGCVQCWCAPIVELAFLFTLRPEPILNALRRFLR